MERSLWFMERNILIFKNDNYFCLCIKMRVNHFTNNTKQDKDDSLTFKRGICTKIRNQLQQNK